MRGVGGDHLDLADLDAGRRELPEPPFWKPVPVTVKLPWAPTASWEGDRLVGFSQASMVRQPVQVPDPAASLTVTLVGPVAAVRSPWP